MKRLFTLLICTLAAIGAKAYTVTVNNDGSVTIDGGTANHSTWIDDGISHTEVSGASGAGLPDSFTADEVALIASATKIKLTGYIDNMKAFQAMRAQLANVKTVDMSGAHFQQNRNSTETVNYRKYDPISKTTSVVTRTYMKNVMAFYYFDGVTEAILPKHCLESICMKTFDENDQLTTTFEIPATVKYIATQAVINTPISRITIPEDLEYINTQAFQNAAIKALIDVTVNGYTAAANGAFDKQNTVGQTNADYPDYATLHFPKGAEEYFTNTQHKLSVATSLNKGKFQEWLGQHYENAANCSDPNGWKEFISAGGGDPEKPSKKVVLRTFSDNVACIVPTGFRAYLVTGVTGTTVEGKTQYTVKLQQIFAIPANTGVILYGEVKDKNAGYVLTKIPYWESDPTKEGYVAPYNRESDKINDAEGKPVYVKNYMVPTVAKTTIYPYYKDMTASKWATIWSANPPSSMADYYTGSNVTDRNFILTNLKGTSLAGAQAEDYVGLFRVKPGVNCGPNKAYLSLPVDVFKSAEGAEALVVKPTESAQIFRSAEWNLSFPDTGNWGKRAESTGVLTAKFAGDDLFIEETDNIATDIQEVNAQVENENDYYTLSGQRVSNPTQGIYVKNGKKVIIRNY